MMKGKHMKKTYKNAQTGLILEVDGPVIFVSEPRGGKLHTEKMHFGTDEYAVTLAEGLARDLRAVEQKEDWVVKQL
jgi:hypothetical protein